MSSLESKQEDEFPWEIGVFDAHCHPTDTMSAVPDILAMNARVLTIMSTRSQDQSLVANVAKEMGIQDKPSNSKDSVKVVPSFGWHPWFSHQITLDEELEGNDMSKEEKLEKKIAHYQAVLNPKPEDRDFIDALPDPIPLSSFITATKNRLEKYSYALVGEIGLDKAFRIPKAWLPDDVENRDDSLTPGGREGRMLSPYRVAMDHQRQVLLAQFKLAGETQRAVSVHGVQAHGVLFETLQQTCSGHERKIMSKREMKRRGDDTHAPENEAPKTSSESQQQATFPPRVCLHSYSGTVDTLKQYMNPTIPAKVYVSFSIVINFSTSASSKTEEVIKAVPNDRILIESDMHIAGAAMDEKLKEIAKKICVLKDWQLSDGIQQLRRNWEDFVFGR